MHDGCSRHFVTAGSAEDAVVVAVMSMRGQHDKSTRCAAAGVLIKVIGQSTQLQNAAGDTGAVPCLIDMLRSGQDDYVAVSSAAVIALVACHPTNASAFIPHGAVGERLSSMACSDMVTRYYSSHQLGDVLRRRIDGPLYSAPPRMHGFAASHHGCRRWRELACTWYD